MKNKNLIFSAIAGFVFASSSTYAQTDMLKEAREHIPVFSSEKDEKKVLKDPYPQALAYIALKFRTASVGVIQEGFGKNITRAASYGILDGIDSMMCQTITNEFYKIFTDKLKSAGVTFLDFEKIKASKRYQEYVAEKPAVRSYNNKNTGTSIVYTQNHEPLFMFGANGVKMYKYQKELDAGVCHLRLTVDFGEFDMTIGDVHHDVFNASNKTTSATAKIKPEIKITSVWAESLGEAGFSGYLDMGGFMMTNKDVKATIFGTSPIYAPYEAEVKTYDEKVPEFAQNHRLFGGGAMQLGTFVIKPSPEAYHKAAIEALTKYADYVVAIIKSYNEKK